jgi:hypothetical protein
MLPIRREEFQPFGDQSNGSYFGHILLALNRTTQQVKTRGFVRQQRQISAATMP